MYFVSRLLEPIPTKQSSLHSLSVMIANMGMDFKEEIRTEGAQWKIVENASRKERCRTRAQAIEEVRKLLRMSRGREV